MANQADARKNIALAHNIISVILIIASLVFCFLPIAKLNMSEGSAQEIEHIMNQVDDGSIYEGLTKDGGLEGMVIDITPLKIVESTGFLAKLIAAGITTAGGEEIDEATKADLTATFLNPDGTIKENIKDVAVLSGALAASVISDLEFTENSMFSSIFKLVASVFAIIYIMAFALIMPIVYLIVFIVSLIQLLKYGSEPEKAEDKLAGKLFGVIAFPILFFLFPCVTSTMSYGLGALLIVLTALVSAVVNLIFSRLAPLSSEESKNANILQCVTIVSIAGFALFFLNIIKTGVFRSFIGGPWADYAAQVIDAGKTVDFGFYLEAIMIMIAVVLVMLSSIYLSKMLKRISLLKDYKNPEKSGSSIAISIIMIFAAALPLIVTLLSHDPIGTATEKIYFLTLSDAQHSALILALVGLCVAFVSELVLLILKVNICGKSKSADNNVQDQGNIAE